MTIYKIGGIEMKKETNGLIIASWVLFVIGLVLWGWLYPVIGALLAHFGDVAETKTNTPFIANVILTFIIFISYMILF